MDSDQLKGNWKEIKGRIRKKWGELTDDEVDQARGNMEVLAGKIQQRYGLSKEEAKRQLESLR